MNREQIIEAMAYSLAVGRGRVTAGPQEVKDAARALTAIEATIPGLPDVLAGKAVIVPVNPSDTSSRPIRRP